MPAADGHGFRYAQRLHTHIIVSFLLKNGPLPAFMGALSLLISDKTFTITYVWDNKKLLVLSLD